MLKSNLNTINTIAITTIRRILFAQEIQIYLKPEWGSQETGHSEAIHAALKKNKENADKFSISHTYDLGGYVILNSNSVWNIGFDIELIDRVSPAAVKRVSFSKTEFDAAFSPESLWTSKEACFKALKGPTQPAVISQLEIGSWVTYDSQIETYRLENMQTFGFSVGCGVVFKEHPYCISIFICKK